MDNCLAGRHCKSGINFDVNSILNHSKQAVRVYFYFSFAWKSVFLVLPLQANLILNEKNNGLRNYR
jgi:hypothetical protein